MKSSQDTREGIEKQDLQAGDGDAMDFWFATHKQALQSRAVVAALVDTEASNCPDIRATLPIHVEICVDASMSFHNSPRRLLICQLVGSRCLENGERAPPSLQLLELKQILEGSLDAVRPDDGPWLWPLHSSKVSMAVLELQSCGLAGFRGHTLPWWQHILASLHIWVPPQGNAFLDLVMRTYGPDAAYVFARMAFFTNRLWMLLLWVLIYSIVAASLDLDPAKPGTNRAPFEIFKAGVATWGVWLAIAGRNRSQIGIVDMNPELHSFMKKRVLRRASRFVGLKSRWRKFRCAAVPPIIIFVAFVLLLLYLTSQLKVYVIYTWGDCINRECTDSTDKHGFWGLIVEFCVDSLLACVMISTHKLTKELVNWVAKLWNFKSMFNYQLAAEMLSVLLLSIERIGTFALIAFIFVPTWSESATGDTRNTSADCSDLVFERSDMFCFARILPIAERRLVFSKAFRGPFIFSPFMRILGKVVLPKIAGCLDNCCRKCVCLCACCDRIVDGLFRFFAVAVTRDFASSGGFKFIMYGWPFANVLLEHVQESEALKAVSKVEAQEAKKETRDSIASAVAHSVLREIAAATEDGYSASELETPSDMPTALPGSLETGSCKPRTGAGLDSAPKSDKESSFSDLSDLDDAAMNLVAAALSQSSRKKFESMSELLEIKMSFIWVLFFTPIMPLGLIPTLIASIIECRTDLAKMLFVKRHGFPDADELMHFTQSTFNRAVVCAVVGWYTGLSVLTYNDQLHEWPWAASRLTAFSVAVWLLASFGFMFRRYGSSE